MITDKKDEIIKDVMSEFEAKYKGVHTEIQHSKCIRDTGFNFDAIQADLKTGGTTNVKEVARRYWSGTKSQLGKGEQNYAVEVNKLLEQRLLKEGVGPSKLGILIKVINDTTLDQKNIPILEKKEDIIEDVISQFEIKHKGVHTETQHSKCVRDTGFNFDAIVADLKSGGIKNILEVAKRYWDGTNSNLGAGEQNYAMEVNKLLEQRLLKEDIDKVKVSLLIGIMNEIVQFGYKEVDKQTKIKHMFYDWEDEMNTLRKIQKCQRVWDHSKSVHPELIDYLLWTAQNAPSKQHEGYYDVYWTADRKVIEELSTHTWGCTHSRTPPSTWKNSQQNANMYMCFVAKEPDTNLNCNADGTLKSNKVAARWENAYVSIGIAIGLVMRAATKLGLSTGGSKNHNDINGDDFWEKKLNILDECNNGEKQIAFGIGIGFPKKGVERYETDQTLLAIGAANGSNLSTDDFDLDYHPRTGKKFRKIKIVDIKTTNRAQDPYGVWHDIPNRADIKINTMRKRNIEAIEIK